MRNRRPMVLAAPFLLCLLFLSGAGFSRNRSPGQPGKEGFAGPETTAGPCRTIAAILFVYPALDVKMSRGAVRDPRDGTERPGCRIHASGPTSGIAGEVRPDQAVRDLLGQSGWEEDPLYAADGPGTTSFAFRKEGVLCMAGGGAHSWMEDGKILTANRYEIEASCVAEPGGTGTGPGR